MRCRPTLTDRSPTAGERLVAIHQPNFLPWLGYFDKLARADAFILLDTVQFPKKAGTWMNRVRVLVQGASTWITVPVVRGYHGLRAVRDMRIDESRPWRVKMIRTLEQAYAKAPFFDDVMPVISRLVETETDVLADFNERGIRTLAAAIGLDPVKIVLASSLNVPGAATDLLINLTTAVHGTAYLAGGGASGYQDDKKFEQCNVRLRYQAFRHAEYPQLSRTPQLGLSIVDALMNCGFRGVSALLSSRQLE